MTLGEVKFGKSSVLSWSRSWSGLVVNSAKLDHPVTRSTTNKDAKTLVHNSHLY